MTDDYIYNPSPKLKLMDRFTAYCRDKWGVNAPEVVTAMVGGFVLVVALGGVALYQL